MEESFIYKMESGDNAQPDPEENVFDSVWKQYERVILESLVTSFGLDGIIRDQYGGDVDTIHNVRKIGDNPEMRYKNIANQKNYEQREAYDSTAYHQHEDYKRVNAAAAAAKDHGTLRDAYTGKKVKVNEKIDLDHVISAKEINDDPGRILAGLDGKDLANSRDNLRPTNRSINRSMKADDIEDYIQKWEAGRPERQQRIKDLKAKDHLTDKERKKLDSLTKIEEADPERMRQENEKARQAYNFKISHAYYTSPEFYRDMSAAAVNLGVKMGIRQALGFVMVEIYFCTKKELQQIAPGTDLKDMLQIAGNGIKKGLESCRKKYKQIVDKLIEGFGAGSLSILTTTIANIFFTTSKNLVRHIRQICASVVQAGKILLFNPDDLYFGDRIKAAAVVMATGASVLAGTTVGETIAMTPMGMIPVLGQDIVTFCSSLVSGLLSCTLLVCLDRSSAMNALIDRLNTIPSEVGNYKAIAEAMGHLAAKLKDIDMEKFEKATDQYNRAAARLEQCRTEDEMTKILLGTYRELNLILPWTGDFNTFMGDRSNHLVFE